MPRPDDHDEIARRRMTDLGLLRTGWVPDQSGLTFPSPEPAEPQPDAPAPAPASLRLPSPAAAPAALSDKLRELRLTASGRALLGLAAACLCLLVVTAWALMRPRAQTPAPAAAPFPVAAVPAPSPSGIVLDVGGRVRRPGLVTVPTGSRVADAIRAAGGAVHPRDLALVDLAAKVTDGQLLLVGVTGADAGTAGAAGSTAPVNLNTATVDQLDALPGIGPVLAQRIVDWRSANNGFRTVRDLDQVSGIGDAIYAELEPLVTV